MLYDKKVMELQVGKFFADWYNEQHEQNYIVTQDKNDEEADIVLEENNDKLFLQLRTFDDVILKNKATLLRMNKGTVISFDPDWENTLNKAIKTKSQHYGNPANLILILWSTDSLINFQYAQQITEQQRLDSKFKEIYIVELPKPKEYTNQPNEGQVIKV